jgi:hypothetical protein
MIFKKAKNIHWKRTASSTIGIGKTAYPQVED